MAKKNKWSWAFIVLGGIIGFGAVMGITRLFAKDEDDKAKTENVIKGTDLQVGDDLSGYKIRLTVSDEEFYNTVLAIGVEDRAVTSGIKLKIDYPNGTSCEENAISFVVANGEFCDGCIVCDYGEEIDCSRVCPDNLIYESTMEETGANENFVFNPAYKFTVTGFTGDEALLSAVLEMIEFYQ